MNFFLEKQLIIFSCTYQPLSFCKILKKLWGCAIFRSKIAHFSWTKLFWYKPLLLSSTYWSFSLCKILKSSYRRSRVMRMDHFGPKQNFFWKIIVIILIYLLALFIVQNFKKILPADPELWDAKFLGLKWPISPNDNFFQKTCWWVLFHPCLSTAKNQSQILIY